MYTVDPTLPRYGTDFIYPTARADEQKSSNHLFDLRVGRQSPPQLKVIISFECETGKRRLLLSHRPLAVIHHVRFSTATISYRE